MMGERQAHFGMIDHLTGEASTGDLAATNVLLLSADPVDAGDMSKVGLLLTLSESADDDTFAEYVRNVALQAKRVLVIGVTEPEVPVNPVRQMS